jgi:hypothetical protein
MIRHFIKEATMKNKGFVWVITGLTLVVGLILAGCDNGSTTPPTKYTVTFDGGEGEGTPPPAQTVESGQSVFMPDKGSLTAPSGKEFNGWRGDGQTLAKGDSYTVTKHITFIAQWKTAFVAVTGISGIPATGTVGTALTLSGTVNPAAATNKTIVWSVKTPGAGVTAINGSSFTPTEAGSLTLTATIADGTAAGSPYTQDFSITVTQTAPTFNPSVNEATANNAATLGLVGTTISSNPTGIVNAAITDDKSKIKITSVKPGATVITVSNGAGMSATIAVSVAASGAITIDTITPQSNPFIGLWVDSTWDENTASWSGTTNYKFDAELVYSTADVTTGCVIRRI